MVTWGSWMNPAAYRLALVVAACPLACARFGYDRLHLEEDGEPPLPAIGPQPDAGAALIPLAPDTACRLGYADCDGNPTNGCEVETSASASSCGTCELSCINGNGATQCAAGVCQPTCAASFGDCDGSPDNGCEQTLDSVEHCGACGVTCSDTHAATACVGARCTPTCFIGFGDCDADPASGCEKDLNNDPAHCGACGYACSAGLICSEGSCVTSPCGPGLGECDGDPALACETSVETALEHCGFCNNGCIVANGTPVCEGGQCRVQSCGGGFGDCDGAAGNGCEAELATTTEHCGACGVACSNANGTTRCSGSACVPTCTTGYDDCDGSPQNGCETALDGVDHCGACGSVCPANGGTPVCDAGVCGTVCDLNGTFALKLRAPGSWPGSTYIKSGSGTFDFWLKVELSQAGASVAATATECGRVKPPVVNSANEPLIHGFPNSLYDNGYLPSSGAALALGASAPGATLSWPLTANQMGINMANPTSDSWPSAASAVAAGIRVDMDGDGKVGMTGDYSQGPTFPRTSASFAFNRADLFYFASRLRFSLSGSLTSCSASSGTATVTSTDLRILGCNRASSAQDCSQGEGDFLDSNTPTISMGAGNYTLQRVAPGADCATIRATLP